MSMSTKVRCSFADRTSSCSSIVLTAASRIDAIMNSFKVTPRRLAALWKKVFCSGATRASSRSVWVRIVDRVRVDEAIRKTPPLWYGYRTYMSIKLYGAQPYGKGMYTLLIIGILWHAPPRSKLDRQAFKRDTHRV